MNLAEARSAKQEFWSDIDNEELRQLGGRVALAHADRTDSVSGRALALRSDDSIPLSYVLSVGVSVRGSGDFGVAVRARALRISFENQIEVEGTGPSPFSRGGDSGSLVVNTRRRAIGLLFAGSTTGGSNGKGLTYVNPIGDVLSSLDATFV